MANALRAAAACKLHAAWQEERGGGHLIADGEGEPVGDGQAGVEQLRHMPGVGVGGLRKAEVDVDGPAVLWVDAAQRAADGRPPVSACSAPAQVSGGKDVNKTWKAGGGALHNSGMMRMAQSWCTKHAVRQ